MAELEGAAGRRDHGVAEQAGWLDHDGERIFVVTHVPAHPRAGLVVCSPVGAEFDTNYRREVLTARALAQRSVAVARFHYVGVGNSSGAPEALTTDSMASDISAVARHLRAAAGVEPALLATRSASFAALGAVAETQTRGVVLWHPPVSGKAYFRELGRLRQMNKMAQQAEQDPNERTTIAQELEARGKLEVAGYEVHDATYHSLIGLDLGDYHLPPATSVLVVQFGGQSLPAALGSRVELWSQELESCTAVVLEESENWWFANDLESEEDRLVTAEAIEVTADWLLGAADNHSVVTP